MKLIKSLILLGAVIVIAGIAFFQLFLLIANFLFAKKLFSQHTPRPYPLSLS